jgi:hypothetical protein
MRPWDKIFVRPFARNSIVTGRTFVGGDWDWEILLKFIDTFQIWLESEKKDIPCMNIYVLL